MNTCYIGHHFCTNLCVVTPSFVFITLYLPQHTFARKELIFNFVYYYYYNELDLSQKVQIQQGSSALQYRQVEKKKWGKKEKQKKKGGQKRSKKKDSHIWLNLNDLEMCGFGCCHIPPNKNVGKELYAHLEDPRHQWNCKSPETSKGPKADLPSPSGHLKFRVVTRSHVVTKRSTEGGTLPQ